MISLRKVSKKKSSFNLKPGSILVVKKQKKYKKNDLVIASIKGQEVIRRVWLTSSGNRYDLRHNNQGPNTGTRNWALTPYKDIKGGVVKVYTPKIIKKFIIIIIFIIVLVFSAVLLLAIFHKSLTNSKEAAIQPVNNQKVAEPKPLSPKNFASGEVKKDILYCNDQTFDLYEPRVFKYENQPVIVYLHGGGWKNNDKSTEIDQLALIDGLRDEGFAIISADYRKVPNYVYPTQIEDVTCLIRYLRSESTSLNIDSEKIGVYGFSAGGHLAAMIGTLDDNSQFNNGQFGNVSSRVNAVATLAGIFDFTNGLQQNNYANINGMLAGNSLELAQPIKYVSSGDSTFYLIHGEFDQFVRVDQDTLFAEKLKLNGVPFETLVVKNADHGLNPTNGEPVPLRSEVGKSIQQFFIKTLFKNNQ